ncbi:MULTISPECIES: hypothetical protein [Enterobacter]|uniref:hypothetical protein n=1 Tax=Enterobacter TaxID=547 RepID=UPI0021D19AE9|nr:hypothetical protein [Enterobacter quasiroggenkampii]MCU6279722.1 hypothetical protein [Enterobacter quasiroggenkampii]
MFSSKQFLANDGQTYDIRIDYEEIEVYLNGVKQGSIELKLVELEFPPYAYYYITGLSLERCRGLGIGRECLKSHIEAFGAPICAADPNDPQMEDGSHLIDDGVGFIEKMREEKIVCPLDSRF